MSPLPIMNSGEASKGGFQGIEEIYGLLVDIDVVPPPDNWETTKDQVLVKMEDAKIIKMAEGEDEIELTDKKFHFYIPYCEKALDEGKKPTKNSTYVKAFLASAEKLGNTPDKFIGQYVTFRRNEVELFTRTDKETGEKEVINVNCFQFVGEETADSEDVKEYIRNLCVGLTKKAVLRQLALDPKAKQFPEFKQALSDDTLADKLGLKMVGTKFTAVED